jgi:hypothetical protein
MSHDHDGHHHHHEDRPSLSALFSNFRTYEAPFHVKVRLAVRNTLIKIRTHSGCCGNHGEPGC